MLETDILIIGKSIAGSSLNYFLKDSGLKSIIVDKLEFPRNKPCGEGLSRLVLDLLKSEGVEIDLQSLPHVVYQNYSIHSDAGNLILGKKHKRGLGIERRTLDLFLSRLPNPNSQNITTKVNDLKFEEDRWIVSGIDFKISAKIIILADGYLSACAKMLGIERTNPTENRFGLSSWWDSNAEHQIQNVEIFCYHNYQLYITPLSSTKLNATVLGPAEIIKEFRADPSKFSNLISKHYCLTLEPLGEVSGAGPFGSRLKTFCTNNCLAIGDAAETFDPASGLGMYHAIYSARLAFKIIDKYCNKGSQLALQYDRLLNKHNRTLRGYDSLIVYLMTNLNSSLFLKFIAKLKIAVLLDRFLAFYLRRNLARCLNETNK